MVDVGKIFFADRFLRYILNFFRFHYTPPVFNRQAVGLSGFSGYTSPARALQEPARRRTVVKDGSKEVKDGLSRCHYAIIL